MVWKTKETTSGRAADAVSLATKPQETEAGERAAGFLKVETRKFYGFFSRLKVSENGIKMYDSFCLSVCVFR